MVPASTTAGDGLRAVMRVSARADYAIRLVVALACRPDDVVSREDLARSERLPVKFVDHVLRQLRNGGMIESRRGRHGGYQLSRPAELISLADVVHAMDEPQSPPVPRAPVGGPGAGAEDTAGAGWLTAVWTGVSDAVDAVLADITVAALCESRRAVG